jgi:two-component system OmpR family sensor kinase
MSTTRTHRSWREPPIVFQILVLLFGGLVIAQFVTLILTMVLPPAPPIQHNMRDVVAALRGERSAGNLTRNTQSGPPDVSGTGWFTSNDSRDKLAALLAMPSNDVRLAFYAPLPFAGLAATPIQNSQSHQLSDAAESVPPALRATQTISWSADPEPLRLREARPATLMLLVDQPAGGVPGGPGGGMPGGGFPGGGFPGGGFPGQGIPGGPGGAGHAGGPGGLGAPGGAGGTLSQAPGGPGAIGRDLNQPAPTPTPGDLGTQPAATTGQAPSGQPGGPGVGAAPSAGPGSPAGIAGGPAARGGQGIISNGLPSAALDRPVVRPLTTAPSAAPNLQARVAPQEAPPSTVRRETTVAPPIFPQQAAPIGPQMPVKTDGLAQAGRQQAAGAAPIPIRPQGEALFGLAPAPFVEGDFVAAMRTADGRWVVVQPAAEGFPNAWQRRVLLWFMVAFALVAPIGWLYARHIVKPLMRFTTAAEQLGRDPSAALVALEGPAEIGRAAHAFNVMQNRLRSFVDDRTAMVGAISHDLRTPLTRLRFRIEEVDDESIREGMNEEVTEMEEMITSVLSFIRDASTPNARERLDLGMLVEDVAQDAKMIGSDVKVEVLPPAPVEIDVLGMRRLLSNLVENAVKYGYRARISLRIEEDAAVAEIEDDGPGVPEDELEKAFEPFYRASNAINSDKKGTGLGLAVCRSIARAHGGDVVLVRSSEGFSAQLRLPLAYDATKLAA